MTPFDSDSLSDAARAVLQTSAGSAYRALVVERPAAPEVRRQLAGLTADTILRSPVRSRENAEALLAGLWLWHDFLDESHTLSQGISSAPGSFWHAIMHRREGDFSNAKYLYARCRRHPALDELAQRERFDPDTFVDLVARVHDKPNDASHAECVRLQRIEWETLFQHCLRGA